MEMTTEEVPQVMEQGEEEEAGWRTLEEKKKLIEELDAFESAGGKLDDFAASNHVSKWSLHRYRRQVNRGSRTNKKAKFQEAVSFVRDGMSAVKACEKAGITLSTYYYYLNVKPYKEMKSRKYTPRAVKEMPTVSDDSYNKSLRARIISLERLVVELSLDRQALIEAREGAV